MFDQIDEWHLALTPAFLDQKLNIWHCYQLRESSVHKSYFDDINSVLYKEVTDQINGKSFAINGKQKEPVIRSHTDAF